jgi:hypothetical protein
LLDANLQDGVDLEESERRAINVLQVRRDKFYESIKKSKDNRKKFNFPIKATQRNLSETGLPQSQLVDTQVEA